MSKVILKYQVSMLTCPSVHPAYPKIHFKITRTVNPLSQPYINRKFQKYISVTICHCHRAFLWDLSLLYLKSMNGIISCTYWLSSAHFILLRVCRFFVFLSYFRGVHYLLRYGSKFNNTYNKAVKLFLGS